MESYQSIARRRRAKERMQERIGIAVLLVVDTLGLLAFMALCLWVYMGVPMP